VKSSHTPAAVFAVFDDPNLLAHGGLGPAVRLAERCGLPALVRDKVRLTGAANGAGTAADVKVMSLVTAMLAGADSIDDTGVLRHGAMAKAFVQSELVAQVGGLGGLGLRHGGDVDGALRRGPPQLRR
jgi:hypothetical protein